MVNLPLNLSHFAHKTTCNGIILSTCLLCLKVVGSPTAANLKIAEQFHKCIGEFSMSKRTQA
ncbi:MAG: hypothetical protein ABSD96_14645 [Candidatus Korobacteraceae bacterium]